jgi:hypothetical protein
VFAVSPSLKPPRLGQPTMFGFQGGQRPVAPMAGIAIDDENPAGLARRDAKVPKLIVKPGFGHVRVSRGVPEPGRY